MNSKVVGQTQAKLCTLKFEKLDACIRPYFANPITNKGSSLTYAQINKQLIAT